MEVYNSSYSAQDLENAIKAVPSIGENGNWWIGDTDTGVFAGGVDVSGAETGQFVKIAAVDGDGRPTAWTPFTPAALNLTGAVEAAYDGSQAVSVEIPSGSDWQMVADYTTTEDISVLSYTGLSCHEFAMYIKGRVNDSTDSLGNAESVVFFTVNGTTPHSGTYNGFYVRSSGAGFPLLYIAKVCGAAIEQYASRKANGGTMGNASVSHMCNVASEINTIRMNFTNSAHLLKAGAIIKVYVR